MMVKRAWLFLVSFVICSLFISPSVYADNQTVTDISWPNCKEKHLNVTALGIVGVNGGLSFRANPCLNDQTLLFHNQYALYLNTGYPGKSYGLRYVHSPLNCRPVNLDCLAYNYGYNAALYSIKYANTQAAHSFVWWLDVETDNSWTTNYNQNIYALIGMIYGLKNNEIRPTIGVYSFPQQWQVITGGWKVNLPTWVASGSQSKKTALSYCLKSYNGSPVWLSQYTTSLDYNYNCLPNLVNKFKIR